MTNTTITAGGVTADMDDTEATAKVIEGVIERTVKQDWIWGEYDSRRLYKCTIEYPARGEETRVTLYCRATGFEMARVIINRTRYMTELHGRIISLGETAGVWVE